LTLASQLDGKTREGKQRLRPWKDVKEAMKDRVDAARAMDADAAASAAASAAAGSDVQLVCFGVWVRDHAGSRRKWKLRRGHTVRVLVAFFVPARPEDDTIQSGADLKLEEPYRYNLASCHQETVLCQQHTVNLRICRSIMRPRDASGTGSSRNPERLVQQVHRRRSIRHRRGGS